MLKPNRETGWFFPTKIKSNQNLVTIKPKKKKKTFLAILEREKKILLPTGRI
jgi:hypothetical protein